jgi:hypothetical protein
MNINKASQLRTHVGVLSDCLWSRGCRSPLLMMKTSLEIPKCFNFFRQFRHKPRQLIVKYYTEWPRTWGDSATAYHWHFEQSQGVRQTINLLLKTSSKCFQFFSSSSTSSDKAYHKILPTLDLYNSAKAYLLFYFSRHSVASGSVYFIRSHFQNRLYNLVSENSTSQICTQRQGWIAKVGSM